MGTNKENARFREEQRNSVLEYFKHRGISIKEPLELIRSITLPIYQRQKVIEGEYYFYKEYFSEDIGKEPGE